ncbi:MAG: hypothetical protein HYZ72_04055 [Deltaproteobacteria bacterium]|nr:hypothetical protein [Deltaproteobacteria bacterium]
MQERGKTKAQLLAEVTALRQQIATLQIRESERAHAEAELRKAKDAAETADRTKSEFVATVSHEVRTPLSVIPRELLDLISAVLDLSRLEAGRLPVEIREVGVPELLKAIEGETQGWRNQSPVAFVWQAGRNLPPIRTDAGKLKMVIKNLIGNAMKFTEEGSITVGTQGHAGGIEIRVADTGIGIPKEALPIIFEPFRRLLCLRPRPISQRCARAG